MNHPQKGVRMFGGRGEKAVDQRENSLAQYGAGFGFPRDGRDKIVQQAGVVTILNQIYSGKYQEISGVFVWLPCAPISRALSQPSIEGSCTSGLTCIRIPEAG